MFGVVLFTKVKNCGTTVNESSCKKCVRFVIYEMNSKWTDLFKNFEHMKTKNKTLRHWFLIKFLHIFVWNSSISYYEAYSNPTAKYVQANYKEGWQESVIFAFHHFWSHVWGE